MRIVRLPLSWCAALLLSFATTAMAEPTAAPGAVCEDSSARAAPGEEGSEQGAFCHASFCEFDSDCQAACPTALTATCVQYTCEYTYSGGGGGGPTGPFCPAQFCSEDWQCNCNGRPGYCGSDWTCHY